MVALVNLVMRHCLVRNKVTSQNSNANCNKYGCFFTSKLLTHTQISWVQLSCLPGRLLHFSNGFFMLPSHSWFRGCSDTEAGLFVVFGQTTQRKSAKSIPEMEEQIRNSAAVQYVTLATLEIEVDYDGIADWFSRQLVKLKGVVIFVDCTDDEC